MSGAPNGNHPPLKTETGIWDVVYNAENRPVSFTNSESNTVVECAYDSKGRRAYKKVTSNGTVTLYQRYIYRGYLQIAALDLTHSNHPALWYITWDPTQPTATRPLAIQKDGAWYTYGWDLTKNICEVFRNNGYIGTSHSYSPYGKTDTHDDIEQPLLWSSEVYDSEIDLCYYNYRYFITQMGKWNERDFLFSKNLYSTNNNCVQSFDLLGLFIKSSCDIKDKLKTIYNVDTRKENKSRYIYKQVYNRQSSPSLSNEIVQNMILSTTTYEIKGRKIEDIMKNLDKHVMTRTTIVQIAQKFKIKFPNEDGKEGNIKRMINKLKRAKNLEERKKYLMNIMRKKTCTLPAMLQQS